MFKTHQINLGTVHLGETRTVVYPYDPRIKIVSLKGNCDCTTPSNHYNKFEVHGGYKAPDIYPPQMLEQGLNSYPFTKQIKVEFINPQGEQEEATLSFSGIIINKKK